MITKGLLHTSVLGIKATTNSKQEILEYIEKYLKKSSKKSIKPLIVVTPNPEQVVLAQKEIHFRNIINQADVALPDGIGLAFVLKRTRISGVELMEALIELAAKQGFPVALIGGREGVALKALECLKTRFSELSGWAIEPEEKTIEEIAIKIVAEKVRIVFVGLGAPKQELFIEKVKCQMSNVKSPLVFMSVGGSFDIISGRTPRAPHAIQAVHLEWLWRLVLEPWRFRRQLRLLQFFRLVLTRGRAT
jgi:N-acetylglucosaminyldiphosphoundecaprenol N-acetyl-beta-D-mannosaminyltransferase